MGNDDWLTERFEAERGRLEALAYRMLGSRADAEDVVQEAWLRLDRADTSEVVNLSGWLTTVISRLALDHLRSRGARRDQPSGMDLSDKGLESEHEVGPEQEAILAESVGLAMLVVLDTLDPAQRVALVLHDMFAVSFDEIASILERSPAAVRQLASRARRRVQGADAPAGPAARQREIVDAFLAASAAEAISKPCWRCSTRTLHSGQMRPPSPWRPRGETTGRRRWQRRFVGLRQSPRPSPGEPPPPGSRWSTERSEQRGLPVGSPGSSSVSSRNWGRSRPSNSSPTQNPFAASRSPCCPVVMREERRVNRDVPDGSRVEVLSGSHARTTRQHPRASDAHWGRSRTTSAGLLSSRNPRKRGCRSRASVVHSAKPI